MAKQTQTKPNKLEANLPLRERRSPTGELLRILKPGTNQTQLQTNHPIFQNFPQKPYFLLFSDFFTLFLFFFSLNYVL